MIETFATTQLSAAFLGELWELRRLLGSFEMFSFSNSQSPFGALRVGSRMRDRITPQASVLISINLVDLVLTVKLPTT